MAAVVVVPEPLAQLMLTVAFAMAAPVAAVPLKVVVVAVAAMGAESLPPPQAVKPSSVAVAKVRRQGVRW